MSTTNNKRPIDSLDDTDTSSSSSSKEAKVSSPSDVIEFGGEYGRDCTVIYQTLQIRCHSGFLTNVSVFFQDFIKAGELVCTLPSSLGATERQMQRFFDLLYSPEKTVDVPIQDIYMHTFIANYLHCQWILLCCEAGMTAAFKAGIHARFPSSLVDAKDSHGDWYPAQIVHIKNEVAKIHFFGWSNRHDEQINCKSSRICDYGTEFYQHEEVDRMVTCMTNEQLVLEYLLVSDEFGFERLFNTIIDGLNLPMSQFIIHELITKLSPHGIKSLLFRIAISDSKPERLRFHKEEPRIASSMTYNEWKKTATIVYPEVDDDDEKEEKTSSTATAPSVE